MLHHDNTHRKKGYFSKNICWLFATVCGFFMGLNCAKNTFMYFQFQVVFADVEL